MLKSFQQNCASHNAIACVVAILVVSAILLATVILIPDARFDRITVSLPVVAFCLLITTDLESGWAPPGNTSSPSDPLLAASYGRAPPV